MTGSLVAGRRVLRAPLDDTTLDTHPVVIVRTLDDYQRVVALRAVCFMAEQACPFEEEFDGNDLTATHLMVRVSGKDAATLRLRWFANFGKIERVCVAKPFRGSEAVRVLLAHAFELAARKGYRLMIGQIQAPLWRVWSRMVHCRLREDRPVFSFSDYDYREIDIDLPVHPQALEPDADPFVIIRPEGAWDEAGVLDRSADRVPRPDEAA